MKPRTYFGLALLFPYILWGICALIVFLLSSQEMSDPWTLVLMPIAFYTLGIVLWLVPYTVLAVGMWIWSRNKSTAALYKLARLAPILLFPLLLIEAVVVSLPAESIAELAKDMLGQAVLLGGFSLVFGYLSVGVALAVFKFLQAKHFIIEETSVSASEAQPGATAYMKIADTQHPHIILFDGICNLCNSSVIFILKHEKTSHFRFASIQSETGKELLKWCRLPTDYNQAVVYIEKGKVHLGSTAALKIGQELTFPWSVLSYAGFIIPKLIRDWVYDKIAQNRYQWFGKGDVCMVPAENLKARFL